MRIQCWKCVCGRAYERPIRPTDDDDPPACPYGNYMIRDYRAEGVEIDRSSLR